MNNSNDRTPLLVTDCDTTRETDYKSHNELRTILSISLVLLILDIGSFIAVAPQTAILEEILCRKYYTSSGDSSFESRLSSERCKIVPIQSEVALINGWKDTFETVPGLVFAIPYGALADRIGRKKVLLLAIIGCFVCDVWARIVCWFPNVIPLRAIWLSGVGQIIGGGATTMTSLFFVMVADICPAEQRTTAFSQIQAAVLISQLLSIPVSAALMSIDPWIPYLASSAIMILGICLTVLLIPETFPNPKGTKFLNQRNEASDTVSAEVHGGPAPVLHRVRQEMAKLGTASRWIRSNAGVAFIMVSFFLSEIGLQAVGVLVQYTSLKFHWTLAKASYLISLRAGINLFVLALLIPLFSTFSIRHLHRPQVMIDKHLTQLSVAFLVLGSLSIFLATSPILLVAGQSLFALGFSFAVTARSLLANLVTQKHLGAIYTGVAVMTYSGIFIGGPLLANSFRWGMKMGGPWMGLPFLIASVLFFLAFLALSVVQAQVEDEADEDEAEDDEE